LPRAWTTYPNQVTNIDWVWTAGNFQESLQKKRIGTRLDEVTVGKDGRLRFGRGDIIPERGSRKGLPANNYPQIRRARMQQLRQQQGEQGGGDEQQGQQR